MPRSYKKDNWGNQISSVWKAVKKKVRRKEFSWKGAAIQRTLEPRGRGIATVGAITRKCLVAD
jgi:hypothetical protein